MLKKYVLLISILLIPSLVFAERVTCKRFKSQSEAQEYYIKYKAKNLDRDGDGQACDCLPGGNGKKCPKKK